MKKTIILLQQKIAAKAGKLILAVYNLYTAVFVRKDDFVPPHTPVQQREIILVRKTGKGYRALTDAVVLS
jgi:hypothetical protein